MGGIVSAVLDPFTGASGVRQAGEQAAAQQREAGVNAANISAFRPVGMTTRFGTSQFTREVDPRTGVPYISSAGYTAAPELSALQNQLFGRFAPTLAQAEQVQSQYAPLTGASERLFNLGQQYLATSPEQAAQDYITSQQALLAPSRQAQLSNVRGGLFARGRGGLGVQTGTGSAPTSPELQAYYNALGQQDLQLAAQAQQAGQQRAQFGAGLFGSGAGLLGTQVQGQAGAYAPLQAQLGLSGQVEQMAQMPYQLGLQLGSAQQPGQSAGAQSYFGGMMQGAQTQYGSALQAQQMNNQFLSSLIGAGAGAYGGGGGGGGTPGMWNASMPYTNVTRGYDPWSSPSAYSYNQQSYGGLF
jgi:hypothetical protein